MTLYQKVSGLAVAINNIYGNAFLDQMQATQAVTTYAQAAAIGLLQSTNPTIFPD
jgi:hypothetical protein